MSTEANKQLVRAFFDALQGGDAEGAFKLLTDDFTWTVIGTTELSGIHRGVDGVRKFLDQVFERLDTSQGIGLDFGDFIAEGDKVVVEGRGRMKGKFGPYNNTYCHVFTVRGGKLAADVEYLDTALIDRALYGKA